MASMFHRTELVVKEWEGGMIYLVQFPRAPCNPNVSPYGMKVETWLRMARAPYTNVSNDMWVFSNKGQVPFIELNGEEIADSAVILERLKCFYAPPMDAKLTEEQKALAHALIVMLDQSVAWVCYYFRTRSIKDFYWGDNVWGAHLDGVAHWLKTPLTRIIEYGMRRRITEHSIGRLTSNEVLAQFRKDLTALQTTLGDKEYLFGAEPATIICTILTAAQHPIQSLKADAAAFGHLIQHLCEPQPTPSQTLLKSDFPKLVNYLERLKATFWKDWDKCTKELQMNAHRE